MACMMKCIVLFFLWVSNAAFAQEIRPVHDKWKFHSVSQAGWMAGQSGEAWQLQTINGIQYKTWFAGIGAGLDYYRFRTIPLFTDIRKEWKVFNHTLFIYTDDGINFTWLKDFVHRPNTSEDKWLPAFYSDAGMGYKFLFKNGIGLLFSAGYSYKRITEKFQYFSAVDPPGAWQLNPERYKYNMNRIAIKAGIEF
jgi:hypothetical protein